MFIAHEINIAIIYKVKYVLTWSVLVFQFLYGKLERKDLLNQSYDCSINFSFEETELYGFFETK